MDWRREAWYTDLIGGYDVGLVVTGLPGRVHHGLLSTWREAAWRVNNPGREEPRKAHFVSINPGRLPRGRGLSPMTTLGAFCSQARVPSSGSSVAVLVVQECLCRRVVTHTAPWASLSHRV